MESKVKTFKFKKIDWYNRGRRLNQPEVTMQLSYNGSNKPCLSISCSIWNNTHTDIVAGGQCLDDLYEYESLANDPIFNKLYYLWQNWHLNDCKNGTQAQLLAVKEYHDYCIKNCIVNFNSFDADIDHLKSIGLYEDNGHVYGSRWFYMDIPSEDLKMINDLFDREDI